MEYLFRKIAVQIGKKGESLWIPNQALSLPPNSQLSKMETAPQTAAAWGTQNSTSPAPGHRAFLPGGEGLRCFSSCSSHLSLRLRPGRGGGGCGAVETPFFHQPLLVGAAAQDKRRLGCCCFDSRASGATPEKASREDLGLRPLPSLSTELLKQRVIWAEACRYPNSHL